MGLGHSADFNYFAKERVSKAALTYTGCWQAPVHTTANKANGEGRGKSKLNRKFSVSYYLSPKKTTLGHLNTGSETSANGNIPCKWEYNV